MTKNRRVLRIVMSKLAIQSDGNYNAEDIM